MLTSVIKAPVAQTTFEGFDIIVIVGQSNAVGSGLDGPPDKIPFTVSSADGFTPINGDSTKFDLISDPKTSALYTNDINDTSENLIATYNIVGVPNTPTRSSDILFDPFDPIANSSIRRGTGFGLSFAREYIRNNKLKANRRVLVVGCAYSGTGFYIDSKDETKDFYWNYENDETIEKIVKEKRYTSLYKLAIRRIYEAHMSSLLLNKTSKNKIVAMLWHQGEQNDGTTQIDMSITDYTNNTTRVDKYKNNVVELLTNLRRNAMNIILDTNRAPTNVPICMGGLLFGRSYNANSMTDVIKDICDKNKNSNFRFVPSDNSLSNVTYNGTKIFNHFLKGRSISGDNVHFDRVSQIEFGKRYFYKFNNDSSKDMSIVTIGGRRKKHRKNRTKKRSHKKN